MNDGKIGTMKVLDSFQRERCTIYLFVTFFNTLINILICGCIVFDLHLLSYFSFIHQPDVNYTEKMKLNFAEPIFSTRTVRYRWIWIFVPFLPLFFKNLSFSDQNFINITRLDVERALQ